MVLVIGWVNKAHKFRSLPDSANPVHPQRAVAPRRRGYFSRCSTDQVQLTRAPRDGTTIRRASDETASTDTTNDRTTRTAPSASLKQQLTEILAYNTPHPEFSDAPRSRLELERRATSRSLQLQPPP